MTRIDGMSPIRLLVDLTRSDRKMQSRPPLVLAVLFVGIICGDGCSNQNRQPFKMIAPSPKVIIDDENNTAENVPYEFTFINNGSSKALLMLKTQSCSCLRIEAQLDSRSSPVRGFSVGDILEVSRSSTARLFVYNRMPTRAGETAMTATCVGGIDRTNMKTEYIMNMSTTLLPRISSEPVVVTFQSPAESGEVSRAILINAFVNGNDALGVDEAAVQPYILEAAQGIQLKAVARKSCALQNTSIKHFVFEATLSVDLEVLRNSANVQTLDGYSGRCLIGLRGYPRYKYTQLFNIQLNKQIIIVPSDFVLESAASGRSVAFIVRAHNGDKFFVRSVHLRDAGGKTLGLRQQAIRELSSLASITVPLESMPTTETEVECLFVIEMANGETHECKTRGLVRNTAR